MCWSHHAGSTPDVCRGAVTSSYQHLNGTVLSRLDVFSKVLVLKRRGQERRLTVHLQFKIKTKRGRDVTISQKW